MSFTHVDYRSFTQGDYSRLVEIARALRAVSGQMGDPDQSWEVYIAGLEIFSMAERVIGQQNPAYSLIVKSKKPRKQYKRRIRKNVQTS